MASRAEVINCDAHALQIGQGCGTDSAEGAAYGEDDADIRDVVAELPGDEAVVVSAGDRADAALAQLARSPTC